MTEWLEATLDCTERNHGCRVMGLRATIYGPTNRQKTVSLQDLHWRKSHGQVVVKPEVKVNVGMTGLYTHTKF